MTRTIDCDVLIIGSGAAGGVLAATISESLPGKRVIIAEKGGHYDTAFFNQREWDTRVLWADKGRRFTADGAMPVKSGECVGGGTLINVGFCHDPLPDVWDRWCRDYGLEGFSFDRKRNDYGVANLNIATATDDVRRRISVRRVDDAEVNENNRVFERACAAAGLTTERWERNARDCVGCGYCEEGCIYGAKQSCDQTYIPDAIARGAQLIHSFDVSSIAVEKRRGRLVASGASGRVRPTERGSRPNSVASGRLHVKARLVVLAAGAIADPVLLLRSGVPDPYGVIGRGLILHPSLPVVGVMERPIVNYRGVHGVSYSTHYAQSHGFYFECLFGHPVYGASVFPFVGRDHFDLMKKYTQMTAFGIMLVDTVDMHNRVEVTPANTRIHYRLSNADRERMRFAAERAIEVMFAAGVTEALLPSNEQIGPLSQPRFARAGDAKYARELQFTPNRTTITSAHCQASVKMSEDPRRGAINSRCESHGVANLVVCDAASFPASCGANPMVAIMALAQYQARRIAAEWDRYAA